jgi:hypothetical protein
MCASVDAYLLEGKEGGMEEKNIQRDPERSSKPTTPKRNQNKGELELTPTQ